MQLQKNLFRFLLNDDGATLIEYGLIAALVSVAVITAAATMGTKLGLVFNNVSGKLK